MTIWIDGWSTNLAGITWNSVDGQWEFGPQTYQSPDNTNGGEVEFAGAFVYDPSFVYTFSPIDFGAPSTFSFMMSMPIAPTGPASIVDASMSAGLTDAAGNGVSLTPNPALGNPDGDGNGVEAQVGEVSMGGPFTNMGVDVGLAASFGPDGVPTNYTYGPYAAGPQPGPAGVWTTLGVRTSFMLSGNNDSAAVTGRVSIVVPEPATIVLLGMAGCCGLAYRVRRGRRAACGSARRD